MFILEVGAAIAAFLLPGKTEAMLSRTMWDAFNNYDNAPAQTAVDFMQRNVRDGTSY